MIADESGTPSVVRNGIGKQASTTEEKETNGGQLSNHSSETTSNSKTGDDNTWQSLKSRIKAHYDLCSTYYHSLWYVHYHSGPKGLANAISLICRN
jgi:hypothetical protein